MEEGLLPPVLGTKPVHKHAMGRMITYPFSIYYCVAFIDHSRVERTMNDEYNDEYGVRDSGTQKYYVFNIHCVLRGARGAASCIVL